MEPTRQEKVGKTEELQEEKYSMRKRRKAGTMMLLRFYSLVNQVGRTN